MILLVFSFLRRTHAALTAFDSTRFARQKAWLLSPFACLLFCSGLLQAQTAHFSGSTQTLGSSLGYLAGVGIDANGNAFYTTDYNSLKELTAASGYATGSVLSSSLSSPGGVAADASGNLFVADTGHNVIKEFTAASNYATVVSLGTGLSSPTNVAIDSSGNLYVTDRGNGAVKKLTAASNYATTTTVITGLSSPQNLAVDQANNIYLITFGATNVQKYTASSSYATSVTLGSGLNYPFGIAVDSSANVFVADGGNSAIKEIVAAGGYTTTLTLGTGFSNPGGIAVDKTGNLFVVDPGTQKLSKIATRSLNLGSVNVAAITPAIRTLAFTFDTAGTIQAPFVGTQGVAAMDYTDAGTGTCTTNGTSHSYSAGDTCTVDVAFNPLKPGSRTGAVELRSSSGSIVTAFVYGVGVAGQAGFEGSGIINTVSISALSGAYPYGITTDAAGNLYIADDQNCKVIKQTVATGVSSVLAGSVCSSSPSGSGVPGTSATFQNLMALAVDGRGDVLAADLNGTSIRKIDVHTGIIRTVAGTLHSGGYSPDGTLATSAHIAYPQYVAVDPAGNYYFSETHLGLVRKVDAVTGVLTTAAGNHASGDGYSGDGGLATSAQLNEPTGLRCDAQGNLYIADDGNDAIRRVDAITGIITTVAGMPSASNPNGYSGDGGPATSALLYDPNGIAIDAAGNLYIADSTNLVIRKVSAQTGIITTIAGTFNSSYSDSYTGDGGAAKLAGLSYLEDVAVGPDGTLYISDSDNGIIRAVSQSQGIAAFGSFNVGTSSPAKDVTVGNNGTATLNLSSVLASMNFTLNGANTSCSGSTSLAAGASCILGVKFQPTTSGPLTGSVVVTDDDNNLAGSTQSLSVSGTGLAPLPTQVITSAIPSTLVSGGNVGTYTATIAGANGSTVTTSTASVTATITGPNGYLQTVTSAAVNGVATLNLGSLPLNTAGVYTVATTSAGLTGTTVTVTVTVGAAAQMPVSTPPATVVSGGNAGTLTATIKDANGNIVTTSTAPVTTTITGPNGYSQSVTSAAVSGVATLNLSALNLNTAGVYTVTTTSAGLPTASATVTVTAGAAAQLATSTVPATLVSGGNLGTLLATIKDSNGNTVTTSTAPVTTTITGPNGYSQAVTSAAVSGVAALNLASLPLNTVGVYTVTTTSAGLPSVSATVTVTAGAATQIVVSAAPSSIARSGNVGTVSGTLKDANGNLATAPLAVTATITGPKGYTQAVTATSSNGAVTFNLSTLTLTNAGTYTLTVSGSGLTSATQTITVVKTTSTLAWATPASIGYGTPLSATQLNATASVAGTFTYSPAAGTTPPAGSDTLSVAFTPTDADNYTTATATVQILVKAVSATTLTASKTTELATMPLTFTAKVTSAFAGTLTGSVSFFDGTTLLGTTALSANGTAVYATTSLGAGTHAVTATYSGDTNYLASSSSAASTTITVADLNLDLGKDNNKTVTPGAAVSYNLPLSPLVTPTFLYDVQLTASGLPPGATYTFSPSTIPAGSGTTPTVLTVQTAKTSAALTHHTDRNLVLAALGFGLFLPLVGRKRLQSMPRLLLIALFAFLSLGTMVGLSGCGNGGFFGATKTSGSYTITVTATSGSLVRTSTVQLTIQ